MSFSQTFEVSDGYLSSLSSNVAILRKLNKATLKDKELETTYAYLQGLLFKFFFLNSFSQYSNIPIFQYSNIPIFQYSNIPIFQYSNIPIFQYSIIPLFLYSSIPLFLYSIFPTFLLHQLFNLLVTFSKSYRKILPDYRYAFQKRPTIFLASIKEIQYYNKSGNIYYEN
ncbi:hypothetical protein ASZ90_003579 [hydrocarbon metagenome]|uniref:Uncharacterized protein n=1 Tax=hydrocarbon metagenome TaxID=938273 RepID=A0A0W8G0G9_9ZZZZ